MENLLNTMQLAGLYYAGEGDNNSVLFKSKDGCLFEFSGPSEVVYWAEKYFEA